MAIALIMEIIMYAITGITGQVGAAVARSLLARSAQVRAIGRDPQKLSAWADQGCDVAIADIGDTPALTTAFSGAEGVFILLPPVFDPSPDFPEARAMIASIRSALVAARPARVVVLSTIGADVPHPNLLSQLALLEAALSDIGLPVTCLRAAWFMENAAWDVADARAGTIHSFLQPLDHAVAMVSVEDVGTTAAALLSEIHDGVRIVELEGPARVSPNDLARAFAAALDHPVHAETVDRASWEGLFIAQGMRNPQPRMRMLDGFNEGWIDFPAGRARKGVVTLDAAVIRIVATQFRV
jgi:uncharacterized protein YbjT (DUF2867 family)